MKKTTSGPDWRRLAPAVALGLGMAGASAVSLAHLAARWEAQAPVRAARAEAWAERQRAEAQPPVAVTPPEEGIEAFGAGPSSKAPDVTVISVPTSRPAPVRIDPVEWLVEPEYRVSSASIGPEFRDRTLRVDFRCRAGTDGRLRGCSATEQPAGSGLGRLLLPKLDQVRVRPQRVDGEPRETTVSFGLTFRMPSSPPPSRPAPQAAPASGVAIPPPDSGPPVTVQAPEAPPPAAPIAVETPPTE